MGMTIERVKSGVSRNIDVWGLTLSNSIPAEAPEVQVITREIQGVNGTLDLSETLGRGVRYYNRKIPFVLGGLKTHAEWPKIYSSFLNFAHGQEVKIYLDSDPDYYYQGRFFVEGGLERTARIGKMECYLDAKPFKFERKSSLDGWFWDTFSFLDGIIRNYNSVEINGTLEFNVIGGVHNIIPGFILNSGTDVYIEFAGVRHLLVSGRNLFYDYEITEGDNIFTFTGTGNVSIDFRGVSL